jgi:hypothetical protein
MSKIDFYEDEAIESRIQRRKPLPEKGLEAWIYKKIPGKYNYKKNILILIIVIIFSISFIFLILGLQNVNNDQGQSFEERAKNTRLK